MQFFQRFRKKYTHFSSFSLQKRADSFDKLLLPLGDAFGVSKYVSNIYDAHFQCIYISLPVPGVTV
jgi:hypothetical protein